MEVCYGWRCKLAMPFKKIANIVFNSLAIISALFTIFGLSIFQLDESKAWVVFTLIILLLVYVFYQTYRVARKIIGERYPNGVLPIASFARYSTSDGKQIRYELFRHIQIKRPFMNSFTHNFVWTGSKLPEISSELQSVGKVKDNELKDGEMGKQVSLGFKETLLYNSCEIIHLLMEIDDSDEKSSPHLAFDVKEPIRSIHFRVELLHAKHDYHEKAKLTCQNLDKLKGPIESESVLEFDSVSKCFSYLEKNPKVGYRYMLKWVRPN